MNRKLEVFIGIMILLALVLFIGFNIFKSNFDPDIVITKISKAMEDNDVEYLKEYIEVEGKGQSLSEAEIIKIVDVLKRNVNIYDLKSLYGSRKNNIYLKQEGKEKLIFNKYILVLKPYDLTISTNIGGVAVYVDDEKVGDIEEEDYEFNYSELLPGTHLVKLVYEGEYGNIETEGEITCFSTADNSAYLDLYLDAQYVEIRSNRDEARLSVNGKDTEISLAGGYKFGPVPQDSEIYIMAKAEIDGNIYESDEYSVDPYYDYYYNLNIEYVEPVEEVFVVDQSDYNIDGKIRTLMEGYQNRLIDAINNNEFVFVEAFIEDGSPLMKSQKNLVKHLNSKGTTEELIGYAIHDISKIADNIYEAKVTENHNIFYSNGTSESISNTWIYTVVNYGDNMYLRNLRR